MWGRGLIGINGACSTLCWTSVTPSATHNQIGPLWYWFPGGWACAHSRTLWISPTTPPVGLGVSPSTASTPTGVFNQRFKALFPHTEALGCTVFLAPPPFLLVYLCVNVGPQDPPATTLWGLLAAAWPTPFHNPPSHWVPQLQPCRKSSLPGCLGLDECFFFISLVVGLPYSLIFCQFWLVFVFKLFLSFWLCEEAQCVYLCLHLGRKPYFLIFNILVTIKFIVCQLQYMDHM